MTQPADVGASRCSWPPRAGGLTVQAFDPKTGRQLWSDQATPSAVLPGIAVSFATVHDRKGRKLLGYYSPELDFSKAPDGNVSLLAHLKVVDPKTGTALRTSARSTSAHPWASATTAATCA